MDVVNNADLNNPDDFKNLTEEQQEILQDWILKNLERDNRFDLATNSYDLKHIFSDSLNGFYITNGQFKGAMLAAGYEVKDELLKNWCFNVSKRSIDKVKETIYLM
jgi:hypothetical protein